MPIRKSVAETMLVGGDREAWFERSERALASQKFKKISIRRELSQVKADYKPVIGTLSGDVVVTLIPEGPNTRLEITATAAIDNVYALGRSPGRKLIAKFKEGVASLGEPVEPVADTREAADVPSTTATVEDLQRLAGLHANGALTDSEFAAAKSQLLFKDASGGEPRGAAGDGE